MKKVIVIVKIEAEIEVVDGGYLGWGSTVQEHVDKAKDDATRYWQVMIKQGSTEPKRVPAKLSVVRVVLTEQQ